MKRSRKFSRKTIVEAIGIRLQVWSRTFAIVSAGLAASLGIMLISSSTAFAGCAGLSGNYAILLQGATNSSPPQPAVGVGAIQLNSATCSVTGELIYNTNGSIPVYPNNTPEFTGTSAQLSGTYSMQNAYSGMLNFADNGACAGCSNSGVPFSFAITTHGTEILGTGQVVQPSQFGHGATGTTLTLTAEKQATFSPTQLVGTFPFSCSATSMGTFFPAGDVYSFTGVIVYPSGPYIPVPLGTGSTCLLSGLPPADDAGVTLSGLCDTTDGCVGNGAPLAPITSQSPPNASDATVNLTDLDDCMMEAAPIPGMSTVLWGTSNQYHWSVGTNMLFGNPLGTDVETCSGGAGGLAGTLTISPTSMSLVTSPTNPLKQIVSKTVKITNNTVRWVDYGGSGSASPSPWVSVPIDNCSSLAGGAGWIQPYSNCSFTVQ